MTANEGLRNIMKVVKLTGNKIEHVNGYKYLGIIVEENGKIDGEIDK